MVYGMKVFYDEIFYILDVQYIAGSFIGCTLPTRTNEFSDISLMFRSLLPHKVKAKITFDDIRLKSNLTPDKTIRFTKNPFYRTKLGSTQSCSGILGDVEGFCQIIPDVYKSNRRNKTTGVDKNHLNVIVLTDLFWME